MFTDFVNECRAGSKSTFNPGAYAKEDSTSAMGNASSQGLVDAVKEVAVTA